MSYNIKNREAYNNKITKHAEALLKYLSKGSWSLRYVDSAHKAFWILNKIHQILKEPDSCVVSDYTLNGKISHSTVDFSKFSALWSRKYKTLAVYLVDQESDGKNSLTSSDLRIKIENNKEDLRIQRETRKKSKKVSIIDNLTPEDLKEFITRQEMSHRGGGIEITLEPFGFGKKDRLAAYQNYLGGGLLGRICVNDSIRSEYFYILSDEDEKTLNKIGSKLIQLYAIETEQQYNLKSIQNRPENAY